MLRPLETAEVKKRYSSKFFFPYILIKKKKKKGFNTMKQSNIENTGQHKCDVLLFHSWIIPEANYSESFV